MKYVKYGLIALLLLIVVAVVTAWLYLEPLVRGVVHKFGSEVVGTEVTLGGFKLNPMAGEVVVSDLKIANPEGYSAPNLLSLGKIAVKVNVKSLMSDKIIVENVLVSAPEITYEMPDFSTSNVMQIQNNISKNTVSKEAKPEAEVKAESEEKAATKEEAKAKSVVIKYLKVEKGALSAITPLQKNETALKLNMPEIEMKNIGEGQKRMSINESITEVLNKILFNTTSVVTKVLGNVNETAKKAVNKIGDKVKEEKSNLLEKVKFW